MGQNPNGNLKESCLDSTRHGLNVVLCNLPRVRGSVALHCPGKGLNCDPLSSALEGQELKVCLRPLRMSAVQPLDHWERA